MFGKNTKRYYRAHVFQYPTPDSIWVIVVTKSPSSNPTKLTSTVKLGGIFSEMRLL
jgi:hypothetical protein